MKTAADGQEILNWLKLAANWRFFSLYFRLPTEQTEGEIARLTAEISSELKELAGLREQVALTECEQEFHRVLGAGGIPACASSYDDNALAGRGPMLADISGFYQAFAYRPEPPPAEVPDHLAVELDFLSYLAVKVAFAMHEGREAEATVARQAYARFLEQHVGPWLERFHAQLERTASPLYAPASALLIERANRLERNEPAAPDTAAVTSGRDAHHRLR